MAKHHKLDLVSVLASLGNMYENGDGVEQDYSLALKWYYKAAQQGDFLGDMSASRIVRKYYFGTDGVKQDFVKAEKWFRILAERGNTDSQYYLGHMYRYGKGVPQNYTEALKWFHKAAEQEDSYAMVDLGPYV